MIGIPDSDLDRPLYRIFRLWFFEHALRLKSLALFQPGIWEDPYEDPLAKIILRAPDYSIKPFYLTPAYAECWSFEGESDALLRAYSRVTKDPKGYPIRRNSEPKYEGVQVKTTPRKLKAALNAFSNKRKDPNLEFYLGAVQYVPECALQQVLVDRVHRLEDPTVIGQGYHRIESLLLKRKASEHESEVRIILLGAPDDGLKPYNVEIKPNELFEEVRFDPRLERFEWLERKKFACELGYVGPFREKSDLYEGVLFDVPPKPTLG